MSAADFGHARLLLAQEKPPVILDAGGWPSSLHIGAIAALQTGHIVDHATRMPRYEAWCSALTYATRANEALYFEDLEYDREHWVADGIERGFRVITAAWIAAADLARWMQSNDEEIGPLLALWFKARGVALPPSAAAPPSKAPECTPATYVRMSEADLLARMPLDQRISIPYAAQILGVTSHELLRRIERGRLTCLSHRTQWGELRHFDAMGGYIDPPELTKETNLSNVEVASKDILESWCMAMEAFPGDSAEDVSARAEKRLHNLIETARQKSQGMHSDAQPTVTGAPATASVFPLADWPALVAYRKANKGKDWGLGNQLDILRTELAHRMKGNKATETDALAAMAKEIGIGREGLRKPLKSSRKRAKEAASSYASTVVRDGKKVDGKAA